MSPLDLASLLCSRLCHDLVNPIGALTNGAELLAEEQDPDMVASCVKLLDDSARQTAALLSFFRLAFGGGGGYGDMIDIKEPANALAGKFPAPKFALQLRCAEQALPKPIVKIVMNLGLIAGEALVRGGTLDIAVARASARWTLDFQAQGPRVIVPDDVRAALYAQVLAIEPSPKVAPVLVARLLLDELNGQLAEPSLSEGALHISASAMVAANL